MQEWSSDFLYFLPFKSEFCNKKLMIWSTVISWSFRASPSLAAKNIINLISVLTFWWCPCVDSSLVLLGRVCLLWPVYSCDKTLLAFSCFILYSKTKFACYSMYLLTSYFFTLVPYGKSDIFFGCLVLEGLIGLLRIVQPQLFQHTG